MNTLEMCNILSPSAIEEECAKFTIEEVLSPFVLHNITTVGDKYTMGLWIKSESEGSIVVRGTTIPTTTEWVRHVVSFIANKTDLSIFFNTNDVYYIYHPKLEAGSKDTDWTEAPEDVEDRITYARETADAASILAASNTNRIGNAETALQMLNNTIAMLVTDENGASLMTQTADGGWTFNMGKTQDMIDNVSTVISELEESIGTTDGIIEKLQNSMEDIESSLEWVKVTTYEDEPCIALGETDSDFRLLITNTRIMFVEGSTVPAYISNQALHINKAVIDEELQQGEFIWKIRSNGNLGLIWKGGSS